MNETSMMRDVLQRIFVTAKSVQAKHVRVINLTVCDEQVDPNKLISAFETLTFTTIAQGARLHVQRNQNPAPPHQGNLPALSKSPIPVQLDSVELD